MSRYLEAVSVTLPPMGDPVDVSRVVDFTGPRVGHMWTLTSATVVWTAPDPADTQRFTVELLVNGRVVHSFPNVPTVPSKSLTHDLYGTAILARDLVQMRLTFTLFSAPGGLTTEYSLSLDGVRNAA